MRHHCPDVEGHPFRVWMIYLELFEAGDWPNRDMEGLLYQAAGWYYNR